MKQLKSRLQQGFTMIELVVVVAIIGVLVLILAPTIGGSTKGSMATLIPRLSEGISSNWGVLANEAGVSTAIASNPIAASGKTVSDVLFAGEPATNVATAYQTAYTRSGIKPLTAQVSLSGGNYVLVGTTNIQLTLTGGGTTPLIIQYANTPDDITLIMAQKINPATTALTYDGADHTIGQLTYNCVSGATTCTVKYSKQA